MKDQPTAVWHAALLATVIALTLNTAASPTVIESGPHHTVWQDVSVGVDEQGQAQWVTNSWTELATGLNFWDPLQKQWEPSVEAFEITPKGYAVAVRGQHKVILAPNINEGGSVDIELPDGQHLRSNPMGLSFFDPMSGKNVLLGEVTNCVGELVAPNVILFPDAFDTVKAALLYTYSKAGFDQSVVLLTDPGEPRDWGLPDDSGNVQLEMWTEWYNPVAPTKDVQTAVTGLNDEVLDFGSMQMGQGQAFFLNGQLESVDVQKTFQKVEGRDFLIEGVLYRAVRPMLERLPANPTKPDLAQIGRRTVKGRSGLVSLIAQKGNSKVAELASIRPSTLTLERGFVLDYNITNTMLTNYVFAGDTTYYLSGNLALYGTNTVFEGGTVIKATNGVAMAVNTPITWGGTPYRPVVLTARDDPSVGLSITPTNPLSGYYATIALQINGGTTNTLALQNLRIANAQTAIQINGGAGHVVSHAQLVNCQNGIAATNADFSLRNALFHNVLTNFTGSSSTGRVEHLTSDAATWLNKDIGTRLYLTNSILAGVTNLGNLSVTNSVAVVNPGGVFQSVGAGYHYLASGSPYRSYAGASTNINITLAAALKKLTTYPPLVLTSDFTTSTTLSPQAQRDTDMLDLGYHYDALDYCWGGLNVTNATLTLTNGVAVGFYGGSGTKLRAGAKFISEGTPVNLNRLAHYEAVQEQSYAWGAPPGEVFNNSATSSFPELRLAFTDVSMMGNSTSRRNLISGNSTALSPLAISHSQLRGLYQYMNDTTYMTNQIVCWTNNMLERCTLDLQHYGYYAPFSLTFFNNLFFKGSVSFNTPSTSYTLNWTIKDCLFDCDSLTHSGNPRISNSNNGYRTGLGTLQGGTSNQVNLTISYQTGPLGKFYYPTNGGANTLTSLINAGSRYATNAGLYHFTTTTYQVKEAGTVVDIGYHYIAVDANGNPVDTDGDGNPDYAEDRNGNGNGGDDSTPWQTYNSPNGLTGSPGLTVFTPLK